ncbi:hypothetical protein PTTG_04081 [Puccinia triticina 1-1 BBBD Race 1]|uniref:DNA 3'-5' helicase n=1 Tax=Puccinia triticina (isolate 1-1 / race 1 (BBBD)) TaxID=630390 RepID=A0A0C4ETF2_PUCT1|nr:hypothetical protein PTTG_04081 [Puccinia triticina 1-1 BBBD Race 1]
MTLNLETVKKIKRGLFSFIYLSPEVFLNSSLFTEIFFSNEFQDILLLIVVDEAHMIYLWGLVASKKSKTLIIFARHKDKAMFRPGYGNIGIRLMATNNVPLLLLLATCRPVAVSAITTSLMLKLTDINMINGELTRPEIRGKVPVISATMELGLGQNLKRVRCVVHMGHGDPASIVQMVGRCGSDGKAGLGLLFMKPTRKNGKNSAGDFEDGMVQNDDDRMDALAVTKVCIRIALTVDNKYVY